MRQTELHLTDEDRELIESFRAKGLRHAREVNRAHILSALDRGIPEAQIMAVLGVGRTAIWRTRAAYLEGGAGICSARCRAPGQTAAVRHRCRSADFGIGLFGAAGRAPSAGRLDLLEQAAQAQPGIGPISRETIRRLLKKTASSRGAS